MFARALPLVLIVLLASCVPRAMVERAAPAAPERLSLEDFRQLPAAEVPQVIDAVTAPGAAARPFTAATSTNALDCLADAVYYEARGEPIDGQRAVAQVVLNRVRHPAFPHSVCGVVFQGSQRATGCQFSFTCDGSMRRQPAGEAWRRARDIAEAALSGYVFAPVGLATHFHADYVHPWWAGAMRRAVTIGTHIFYRWPGQWGDPMTFSRPYQGWENRPPAARADGAAPAEGGGTEFVAGVTIHRGGSGGTPAPAAARPEGPAIAAPTPVRLASIEVARGGVRVHRAGRARSDDRGVAGVAVHSGVSDDAVDANAATAATR
jgi:spore germination cell wall hydrolase CwlJ-like protein